MQDIGNLLAEIMTKEQCSSVCAFLILKGANDVSVLQSKPTRKTNRRLRDTGYKQGNKTRLG